MWTSHHGISLLSLVNILYYNIINGQAVSLTSLYPVGRFRYFAWMSNPMNGLVSNSTLLEAKQLVSQYREGTEPPDTTDQQVGTKLRW